MTLNSLCPTDVDSDIHTSKNSRQNLRAVLEIIFANSDLDSDLFRSSLLITVIRHTAHLTPAFVLIIIIIIAELLRKQLSYLP
jgi:hypothetical protein